MTLCTLCASDPPHLSIFSPLLSLPYLSLFPLLSVNPGFPGQDPEETLDLDGAPALRPDSSIQAWELLQASRRSNGRGCVCVCVCFKRGVHVEAVGKHTALASAAAAAEAFPL